VIAEFPLTEKLKEVAKCRDTLNPETDRGCALMAAAYLDSQLELLLRKSFIPDEDVPLCIHNDKLTFG
jgi:hypothetical protein